MERFLFSSESVTEGHPDKLCDQVSDAVLDAVLKQDSVGRVACEATTKTGYVMVFGEMTTHAQVDVSQIVRDVVREIGYDDSSKGFDYRTCAVLSSIEKQSQDIALGVDGHGVYEQKEQGAGDQGMMFGYACKDTPELMPMPISLAHRLTRRLARERKEGRLPFLRPDGKAQVTVRYEGRTPVAVETVVLSSQHEEGITHETLQEALIEHVIRAEIPGDLLQRTKYLVNPTGRFVVGGPMGDSGLTGRKIIVDTYGGWSRHGGGCFSGKDPSKVDRSASYYARYMAKHVVAAGFATHCEVQIAYAIGISYPVSVYVHTFGTGIVADEALQSILLRHFDCRPASMIQELDLLRPIYRNTSTYGHFGRQEPGFSWEAMPKLEALRAELPSV